MQESPTWRTVLADILKRPGERQRIAEALGINQLTLKRWVQNQSDPRPQYLQQLLTLVPEQQTVLRSLLEQEFPEIMLRDGAADEAPQEIASSFYAEVIHMLATLPPISTPGPSENVFSSKPSNTSIPLGGVSGSRLRDAFLLPRHTRFAACR